MAKIPDIRPGDLVKVHSRMKEGKKERVIFFQGVVIQIRGAGQSRTFTVRKISAGIGVERIFPFQSPIITKIEIKKKGKVRRAKLNYLRQRKGRKMKIKEAVPKSLQAKKKKPDTSTETKNAEPVAEAIEKTGAEKPATKPIDKKKQKESKKPKEQESESAPGQKTLEKT
jgi:large subunit ribosomal protein L19